MLAFKNRLALIDFILHSFILANISYWDWQDWIKANQN